MVERLSDRCVFGRAGITVPTGLVATADDEERRQPERELCKAFELEIIGPLDPPLPGHSHRDEPRLSKHP